MVMALFPVMFVLGYTMIALEHPLKINKSASALVLGSVLWLLWFIVTKNAPASELTLARGKQVTITGWKRPLKR